MIYYYDSALTETTQKMELQLKELLRTYNNMQSEIIILCIGSDRSTGDSLGPVTGYLLENLHIKNVYGSLRVPVHAANLSSALELIHKRHFNPFIIAIDASLGIPEHVGYITLGTGPLIPGLGVQKKLPEVGDLHITGIVNTSGNGNDRLLQTTHLSIVIQIADVLANVCSNAINACSYMPQSPDQSCPQLLTS
ncbi:MAG: spore protease YyaC [Lachnospira sp.]|nr:spore protease YyaC [Lachnospira sp.]